MMRVLDGLAPVRWWRALRALAGGARVHPQARWHARAGQLVLGRGCKLGARVTLDAGRSGRIHIGERVWIAADVELQTDSAVHIGAGSSVQRRCTINGSTRLGAGCILAPDVFISSGTHPFRAIAHLPIREQERQLATQPAALAALDRPVWIQDDCWLGTHVVVCPGVTIGKGSVVGANAVVTADVAPYSIIAGLPARRIGSRLDWRPPARLQAALPLDAPYFLSAQLPSPGGGDGARLSATTPLLAALAAVPGLRGVALDYRASSAVQLHAGALVLPLAAGSGRLELPAAALRIVADVAYCELWLPDDDAGLHVEVLALQTLTRP